MIEDSDGYFFLIHIFNKFVRYKEDTELKITKEEHFYEWCLENVGAKLLLNQVFFSQKVAPMLNRLKWFQVRLARVVFNIFTDICEPTFKNYLCLDGTDPPKAILYKDRKT